MAKNIYIILNLKINKYFIQNAIMFRPEAANSNQEINLFFNNSNKFTYLKI